MHAPITVGPILLAMRGFRHIRGLCRVLPASGRPGGCGVRGLPVSEVNDLVVAHIQWRAVGFIGEERVDVSELNLTLAALPTGSTPRAEG